jgi:CRISPR-associated protein Cas1
MIKRTLYFGNPAYLSLSNQQMVIKLPQVETNPQLTSSFKKEAQTTLPIEDIGLVILDHSRITLTQALMAALLSNNVALITCDAGHLPVGMMLNLDGNTLQAKRFQHQIEASLPLKKQLWQQTVKQKIFNQGVLLEKQGDKSELLFNLSRMVKSGDPSNIEGRAAAYYWQHLFGATFGFKRDREGKHPNAWLNYGYAILRACVARSIVGSGLLATLGIHHRNQYNAYCLADDLMEPYRPYVDEMICSLLHQYKENNGTLEKEIKQTLLQIPVLDVVMEGNKSPLMIAVQQTTASLSKCFEGKEKRIKYPQMQVK